MSNNTIISILSYIINYLVLLYFGNLFFSKNPSKKEYFFMLSTSILISILQSTIFYQFIEIKSFLTLVNLYLFNKLTYHAPFKKILLYMAIFTISAFVSEILCVAIGYLIYPEMVNGLDTVLFYDRLFLGLLSNVCLACILTILLFFTKIFIQFYKNYFNTFILLLAMMFTSSYLAVQCTTKYYASFKNNTIIPPLLLFSSVFIIWLIAITFLIRELKRVYYTIEQEILIKKLMIEYQKQTETLLKEQNSDQYSYLRHDIMNFIQTYATIQEKEK